MNIECNDIQRLVWTEGPALAPADHLRECNDCREQARQAADLQAALRGLGTHVTEPPVDLYASIIDATSKTRFDKAKGIVSHPTFWKSAVGAAAAAATVGLIVVRRRGRDPEAEEAAEAPSLVA